LSLSSFVGACSHYTSANDEPAGADGGAEAGSALDGGGEGGIAIHPADGGCNNRIAFTSEFAGTNYIDGWEQVAEAGTPFSFQHTSGQPTNDGETLLVTLGVWPNLYQAYIGHTLDPKATCLAVETVFNLEGLGGSNVVVFESIPFVGGTALSVGVRPAGAQAQLVVATGNGSAAQPLATQILAFNTFHDLLIEYQSSPLVDLRITFDRQRLMLGETLTPSAVGPMEIAIGGGAVPANVSATINFDSVSVR
jgi:hypothetical protein